MADAERKGGAAGRALAVAPRLAAGSGRFLLAPLLAASTLVLTSSSAPASADDEVVSPHAATVSCGALAPNGSVVGQRQRWRQSFGLPCDQAVARSIDSGIHVTLEPTPGFDVPITTAEQSQLASRESALQALANRDFAQFLESLPGYAGSYFDQSSGGIATVLCTGDARARWDALARRFPFPDYLTVRRVARSYSQLMNLQRRVVRDMRDVAALGITVTSVDLDLPNNAVVVRVTNDVSTVAPRLVDRYGPGVHVEYGSPAQLEPFRTGG